MKCKYYKKCMYYNTDSSVCNQCQTKDDDEPYCGYYRFLENEVEVIAQ